MIKILHIADPHIDSPLRGLAKYPGLPEDQLRSATRDAFASAVSYAVREAVDLVLIAGDLFDGSWRDMGTGLWTVDQFHKLREAEIPVLLIRGNHDAMSKVTPLLNWPENVFEFSADQAETWTSETLGVAVHGQSFAEQAELRDLAAAYPNKRSGIFNVGLLHTSLAGSPQHDTYAPTSVETLLKRDYDYWALGHIHQREVIEAATPIVFAGNIQGRHIRETGPKGAILLHVDGDHLESQAFVPFDVVRWEQLTISTHEDDSVDDVLASIEIEMGKTRHDADGKPVVVRVGVEGVAGCHDELAAVGQKGEFDAAVRSLAREHDQVWVERVRVQTLPPLDLDSLRQSDGLLAMLLDDLATLKADDHSLDEWDFEQLFAPLIRQTMRADVALGDCGVDLNRIDNQRRWIAEAEAILLSALAGETGT